MTTQTYAVTGMTCGHCAAAISEEVSAIDHVTAVTVDHTSGRMDVTTDAKIDFAEISAAVAEAGDYRVAQD